MQVRHSHASGMTAVSWNQRVYLQAEKKLEIPSIIEFHARYTDQVKHLLTTVLQFLDLSECSEVQRPGPAVTYDDSDLERIDEIYTNRSRFWLAVMGDEVIGMAAIAEVDANAALLRRMFVAQAYHGKEIGKRLLVTALSFAEDQGYQTIHLDTHSGMKRAHAFYEKHGFRQMSEDARQRHYVLSLVPKSPR